MAKKCKHKGRHVKVELLSWTERQGKIDCDVTSIPNATLVVEIRNYTRKDINVEIEAYSVNDRILFEDGNPRWKPEIITICRKPNHRSPTVDSCDRNIYKAPISNAQTEWLRVQIKYRKALNGRKNLKSDEVTLELSLK